MKVEDNIIEHQSWSTATVEELGKRFKFYWNLVYNTGINLLMLNVVVSRELDNEIVTVEDYQKLYKRIDDYLDGYEPYINDRNNPVEFKSSFNDNTNLTSKDFENNSYWCYVKLSDPKNELKEVVWQLGVEWMCDA